MALHFEIFWTKDAAKSAAKKFKKEYKIVKIKKERGLLFGINYVVYYGKRKKRKIENQEDDDNSSVNYDGGISFDGNPGTPF